MSFGRYRLMSQLGAGSDGVRYRASDRHDGAAVEMVLLGDARAVEDRWRAIRRRLRMALMISHTSSRRVVGLEMDEGPPFVALEWFEGPSLAELGREESEAIPRTTELAMALAAGHRLGLVHGKIAPGLVRTRRSGGILLDWTGLEVDAPAKSRPIDILDDPCRAPEVARGALPDPASDIYSLGAILDWRLGGLAASGDGGNSMVVRLIREMLDDDPAARPTARALAERLTSSVVTSRSTQVGASALVAETSVTTAFEFGSGSIEDGQPLDREQLGRFRLVETLGQGGMGTVYRGEDLSDGSIVAIKVLKPAFAGRPESLKRFHKEARLLAEVNNSRVANLIELNEDDGVHYIALEYVEGINLADWISGRREVDERASLAIMADVARALEGAHERGIVHRDIKPENILVIHDPVEAIGGPPLPRIKLSDFGLARHVVESESLVLTRDGAIIGTPLYMAPSNAPASPRSARGPMSMRWARRFSRCSRASPRSTASRR